MAWKEQSDNRQVLYDSNDNLVLEVGDDSSLYNKAGTQILSGNGGSLAAHELSNEHLPYYPAVYFGATYKRAVVALRFDDSNSLDQSVLKPLLDARYLPAGFAAIKGRLDTGGNVTTAQLLQMQADGHEIMSHTRNHTDPTLQANPAAFFLDEMQTVTTEFRAAGFFINAWVQPGTWTGAWNLDSLAKMAATLSGTGSTINEVLKQNVGAAETYAAEDTQPGGVKPLPSRYHYGTQHLSIDTLTSTAAMTAFIDVAIQYGGLTEILFHSFNLDTAGQPTTAQITAFLDYLQAARDAGVVDVLTPTAAVYATRSDYKLNLMDDPSFEESTPGAFPAKTGSGSPAWYNNGGTPSSVGGVGRPASLLGPPNGNAALVSQANPVVQDVAGLVTRSLRFDVWARTQAGANVTAQLQVKGMQFNNGTPIVTKTVTLSVGTTYAQLTALVGTTPTVDFWRITLSVTGAGSAYFDDCSMVKT